MPRTTMFACLSLSLGIIAAAAILSHAGPLDPPAGPVAPSYKTLTEVEPRTAVSSANTPGDADSLYRIAKPGSYYLTGNITGVAGKCGIEIAASGVTLDLDGFEMLGVSNMGAFDGITVTSSDGKNITIRNGSIRNWGDCGIEFNSNAGHPPTHAILQNLHISDSVRLGVALEWDSMMTDCKLTDNRGDGVLAAPRCAFTRCIASGNGGDGFAVNYSCTIVECIAASNTGVGFALALSSTMSDSAAHHNATGSTGQGCTLTGCTFYDNIAAGFDGFEGNTITACTAYRNGTFGIGTARGSTVTDCSSHSNQTDGIRVVNQCLVRSNTCANNGEADGAGIHATSTDNRIEGNICIGADRGIDVDAAGNLIIRNSCSGNTINWVIVANNVCGPILDRTAPGSAAISGNSAPDSTGSTHPNANFTY